MSKNKNENMRRTQICLTKQELKKVKEYAEFFGISKSEMVRRIIDNYNEEKK